MLYKVQISVFHKHNIVNAKFITFIVCLWLSLYVLLCIINAGGR